MRVLFILLFVTGCICEVTGQELRYTVCENCWLPDSLGNHRAVVEVLAAGKVARAMIPWRRRDYNPDGRNFLVTDKSGRIIKNVKRVFANREVGDILFEPVSGAGKYYVYFMKYLVKGRSNYPTIVYPPYHETADPNWVKNIKGAAPVNTMVVEIQAIDELNSFFPMEVIAMKAETARLREKNKAAEFLVFPEDRLHPVKMKTDLPQRWIQRGPQEFFDAEVSKGENFSFQLGVFAHAKKLENVTVKFNDLAGSAGAIAGSSIS